MNKLKGIIFDMDGTIVNSYLDFQAMRRDLGLFNNEPILEAIDDVHCEKERARLHKIVDDHEMIGARKSELIENFESLLELISSKNITTAVLTRNSKVVTDYTLNKFNLKFEHIVTRDCHFPPKPNPEGLLHICKEWGIAPQEACYVGDFSFDIECAQNANMKSILINWKKRDLDLKADLEIENFSELISDFDNLIKERLELIV